jgi:hypothetical protein
MIRPSEALFDFAESVRRIVDNWSWRADFAEELAQKLSVYEEAVDFAAEDEDSDDGDSADDDVEETQVDEGEDESDLAYYANGRNFSDLDRLSLDIQQICCKYLPD